MKTSPNAPLAPEQAQEVNLLYVVMTRARHQLDLNKETAAFLTNIARHRGDLQEARAKAAPAPSPQYADAPRP
jgi:ATP-dependent exoDNAse (exonuclease V) beta subunit